MAKRHIFDAPRTIKRLLWVFYAVCAALLALDLVLDRHVVHAWERLFGFYAVFGFAACVGLVLGAKQLRKLLMRGEDYYDR